MFILGVTLFVVGGVVRVAAVQLVGLGLVLVGGGLYLVGRTGHMAGPRRHYW